MATTTQKLSANRPLGLFYTKFHTKPIPPTRIHRSIYTKFHTKSTPLSIFFVNLYEISHKIRHHTLFPASMRAKFHTKPHAGAIPVQTIQVQTIRNPNVLQSGRFPLIRFRFKRFAIRTILAHTIPVQTIPVHTIPVHTIHNPDDSPFTIFHVQIFPHSATEAFETYKFYHFEKSQPEIPADLIDPHLAMFRLKWMRLIFFPSRRSSFLHRRRS